MAKARTTRQYRKQLDELNEIRARPDKPTRTKRELEGDTSAYGVELEGKETRRPKQTPKSQKKPRR
ncbi:MAG: hypothetical protein BroJett029_25080 [Alphaproteobacteria bacterium]|nr:MAG: hypothetical protein BroJett029_25080 [Alphaproteobacteria bacterium]